MARMMDTPESAAQPQVQGGASEEDTFVMMVSGLRSHIFGKGEQGIVEQMAQADEIGRVMGEITFALVQEAAHQAEENGRELSMDILMGVATEVIDDLAELAIASGMEVQDKDREYALLFAQQLYVDNSNPSDDERNIAKQSLAAMKEDGSVDTATKYVQQRGAEEGVDPFDVEHMGDKPSMMQGK